jgi:tripartite motif-containing protein 2/3
VSCEITNIIYLISCGKCGLQYVGETGRRARDRLYEHLYSIKQSNRVQTPVSSHFSTSGHTFRDLRFQVIERCHTASDTTQTAVSRKRRELFWIWELKTITPAGINHMV